MALQRQCREVVLVLTDQVFSQQPLGERQFGGLEDGPAQQTGLRATVRALPIPAPLDVEGRVSLPAAHRADETRRPAPVLQRLLALLLGAVLREKLRQRLAVLKLDTILGHCGILDGWMPHCPPRGGSKREPASADRAPGRLAEEWH